MKTAAYRLDTAEKFQVDRKCRYVYVERSAAPLYIVGGELCPLAARSFVVAGANASWSLPAREINVTIKRARTRGREERTHLALAPSANIRQLSKCAKAEVKLSWPAAVAAMA